MRTLAIGDIHGCLTALETLIDYIKPSKSDTIVTLGDYIDRGPDSKGVIDYIIKLKETHQVITLKGNHELMIKDALHSNDELFFWLINGGDSAFHSFGIESLSQLPQKYWDFFDQCSLYHETDHHILVHAGLDPELPCDKQNTEYLCWQRILDTKAHYSGKKIICGHTPQTNGLPLHLDHAICIDTHIFGDQWLTCLDIKSGEYWQANKTGETRKNHINNW